jgi:tRNA threonylcarbamoyladenosine biosynthesis protein TsaB
MGRTSAALALGAGEPVLVRRLAEGEPQAEGLMPLIKALMAEAELTFASLDRIAVSTGPGGFSGIRTGVAAARGLGLAAGVPVVGTTSFQIMAAAFEKEAPAPAPHAYGLAAPAGLSAVFCQILGPGREALTEILVMPHSETGTFFEDRVEVLAGPAAGPLSEAGYVSVPLQGAGIVPDAGTLAELAPQLDPARDLPSPHYVRSADARPQTKHILRRADD